MPETQTVSGVVGKVTEWKSGKGYFLNLRGDENDYFGFKKPKVAEGETAAFEVKEGTDRFADKVQIIRRVASEEEPGAPKEHAAKATATEEPGFKPGDRVYMDKQELIVKQCCIKAAAQVVGHAVERGPRDTFTSLAEKVIDMADSFFCYIMDLEPPKEPEEEPADEPEEGE